MRHVALGLLALAGVAGTSFAAPYMPPPAMPDGLTKITDNLARKYPLGLYNRMGGDAVAGADSDSGFPVYALAMAFTPATDRLVKRIQVPVQRFSAADKVTVALYDDVSGKPGSALKTWHLSGVPQSGTCCALLTAKSGGGIPVAGGHQYWVVVGTDAFSHDFVGTWLFNTTDQVTPMPFATYCEDRPGIATCSGFTSGQWKVILSSPGLAFSVYGN